MITYSDVLPALRRACCTYEASIEAAVVAPDDGEFINIGYFVEHLIRRLDEGETCGFTAAFSAIEQVLADGDSEAFSLISDGFLDDLANLDFMLE
jgi:hypothetical protein